MVVLGHGPLSSVHLDGLLIGDGGVPLDQGGHHSSGGLDTQRQGSCRSDTASEVSPVRMAACTAAP